MRKHLSSSRLIALLLLFCLLLASCGALSGDGSGASGGHGFSAKPWGSGGSKEPTVEVTLDQILEYANSSSYVMEFAQRFFSDYIIYKDSSGRYTYEPVNPDLPRSDYDWNNLVDVEGSAGEKIYVEDGAVASIKGIDVSRYQKEIDWEKVREDGVSFAMIRLGYRGDSEGKLQLDPLYEDNIEGALNNDIAVGVYFWTQAVSVEEAEEEAEFVLDALKPYKITWPVALDIEEGGSGDRTSLLTASQRTDIAVAFCERIREAGYTPMLYSNIRWFIEKLELERLMDYEIWFAQYYNRPFFPYAFQMWQYTSNGSVAGIEGDVDYNLCFKDYAKKE